MSEIVSLIGTGGSGAYPSVNNNIFGLGVGI